MQNNFSTQQAITKELNKGIRPEFAAYLETAADGKRKLAAQLIYQHHDIALPYKNDANTYTLYVPSESDKKQYQKNFIAINILKMKNQQMRSSLFTAGLLLIIHGSLFLAFLVFLVLYEKKTSWTLQGGTDKMLKNSVDIPFYQGIFFPKNFNNKFKKTIYERWHLRSYPRRR